VEGLRKKGIYEKGNSSRNVDTAHEAAELSTSGDTYGKHLKKDCARERKTYLGKGGEIIKRTGM